MDPVIVIGGGLAGCEAAWQLAARHIPVTLYEMRGASPHHKTPAHVTTDLAELVCSNSFRSDDIENAVGLLHEEMRRAGSLILRSADKTKVPAGSALAVDRIGFAEEVKNQLESNPMITIKRAEVTDLPLEKNVIIASGPLTSEGLSYSIANLTQQDYLAFFDAISPIVHKDSIDFNKAWFQSRYDKGDGSDYINCPLDKETYEQFIIALLDAEKTEFKEWEKKIPYFEGCLPIEVMAGRGIETLRFGPMKPVGLTDPRTGKRAYAVVQLRQDNKLGTLYNIVGFQTKLKYGEQKRIFQMIPGLERAEFARFGGIHRNTFINSPTLLDPNLSFKNHPNIKIAGQITGVEGYLESASIGLLAGIFMAAELKDKSICLPPTDTALGSLLRHITTGASAKTFQPMNINYGLFDPINNISRDSNKKALYSTRALSSIEHWLKDIVY
jgi:methylenetetrahydrofolate--tRNA-(uracil-5-)-methyltransferase